MPDLPYRHWYREPEDDAPAAGWPLILFLHGVGERGDDLSVVARLGPPKASRQWPYFPFAVAAPQCASGESWAVDRLVRFLDGVLAAHAVDPDRVYLTGLSMGGYGTWHLAAAHPERFAAAAPVCGGGDPRRAGRLQRLPVWAFHGAKDPVVPLAASREMVDALERIGAPVRFTVYPGVGHDSWTRTYADWELYQWFLDHHRPRVQRRALEGS
ncbi:MAG TPA: prolyl oligopeptidase family serine peptidase [Deferrisomatales bacterium]|nr:prolyl oligopeptidase family serine peptidase [Deferrisomatales bacterium]